MKETSNGQSLIDNSQQTEISKTSLQTPSSQTSTRVDLSSVNKSYNNAPTSTNALVYKSAYNIGAALSRDLRFDLDSSLNGPHFFDNPGGKEALLYRENYQTGIETLKLSQLCNDIRLKYHTVLVPKHNITGQILENSALDQGKKIVLSSVDSHSKVPISVDSACLQLPKSIGPPSLYNLPQKHCLPLILPLATYAYQTAGGEINLPAFNLLQQFHFQLLFIFFCLLIEFEAFLERTKQHGRVAFIVLRRINRQVLFLVFFVFMELLSGAGNYGRRVPPDEKTSYGRAKSSGGLPSGSNDEGMMGGRRSERFTGGSPGGGGAGSSGGGGGREGGDGGRRREEEEDSTSQSDSNEEEEEGKGGTSKKKKRRRKLSDRRRRPRLSTIHEYELPQMLPVDAPSYMPFPNIPLLPHEQQPSLHEPESLPFPNTPILPHEQQPSLHEPESLPFPNTPISPHKQHPSLHEPESLPLQSPQAATSAAPNFEPEGDEPNDCKPVFKATKEESAQGQVSGSECVVPPKQPKEMTLKANTHHPCSGGPPFPGPPSPMKTVKSFKKNKSASMHKHSPHSASHTEPQNSHTPPYYSDDSGSGNEYVSDVHVLVSGRSHPQQNNGGPDAAQEQDGNSSGACGYQAPHNLLPNFQQQVSQNVDIVQPAIIVNEERVSEEEDSTISSEEEN